MAPVTVEVTIERPRQEVFDFLADAENLPRSVEEHDGGFEVEDANGGATRVRLRLEPRPKGVLKLLAPVVRRSARQDAVHDLARLKGLLERPRASG